jgi:hypothetical protein
MRDDPGSASRLRPRLPDPAKAERCRSNPMRTSPATAPNCPASGPVAENLLAVGIPAFASPGRAGRMSATIEPARFTMQGRQSSSPTCRTTRCSWSAFTPSPNKPSRRPQWSSPRDGSAQTTRSPMPHSPGNARRRRPRGPAGGPAPTRSGTSIPRVHRPPRVGHPRGDVRPARQRPAGPRMQQPRLRARGPPRSPNASARRRPPPPPTRYRRTGAAPHSPPG